MLPVHNIPQGAAAQAAGSNAEVTTGAALSADFESTWRSYEERLNSLQSKVTEPDLPTVTDLMALLVLIIEAARDLRNQVTRSRIDVSASVQQLASRIAETKMSDAQKKFAISLAAGVATMAVSTAATMRMSMPKQLQDKHITGTSEGRQSKVSDLTAKEKNDFQIQLQEQRTAKYSAITRVSEMANSITGSGNEIQHAAGVNEQEQGQSIKELMAQYVPQLEEFINSLGKELAMLNSILEAITRANLATNR